MCAKKEDFTYTSSEEASIAIYTPDLESRYRILIYSGDADGAVSTYGTKAWIEHLDWPVTSQWRPYKLDDQLAGNTETRGAHGNFYFATIHGAGHNAA